ncbi:hypothetical protein BRDID11002_63140 [Bradyrhizobium diazoefficiens]
MAARPGRIANDWLAYIRPHLRPFEALEHGERGDYIAKLSEESEAQATTRSAALIAAAQFLEAEGITELAPDVRMPVAAVERVARIAARQPERRRKLLEDVSEGKLTTIMELRELLKKCRKSAKRPGGAHSTSSLDRVARELEIRNICRRGEVVLARADEDEFGWLLTTPMKRSFIVRLPEARLRIDLGRDDVAKDPERRLLCSDGDSCGTSLLAQAFMILCSYSPRPGITRLRS